MNLASRFHFKGYLQDITLTEQHESCLLYYQWNMEHIITHTGRTVHGKKSMRFAISFAAYYG